MSGLLIVVGLGAYASFFLWRVRVEKGWIGWRPLAEVLAEWTRAFAELERVLGSALIPVVDAAAAKIAAFVESFNAPERSDP